MSNTELSDEQLGRLWCQLNNRAPDYSPRPGYPSWRWVYDDGPTYALPHPLYHAVYDMAGVYRYHTEAEAYSAVGASLRELHKRAVEIAAVLGCVL